MDDIQKTAAVEGVAPEAELGEEKAQPSFWSVLPANVRYSKSLSSTDKIIYSEITSLCNKEGYCWATNSYFAELFGISKAQISSIISRLAGNNVSTECFIEVVIDKKRGNTRRLYPAGRPYTKKSVEVSRKMLIGLRENLKSIINNKTNNKNNILESVLRTLEKLKI